jgi:hypothetical protein
MKDIKESFNGVQGITPYLKGERIDEGLKDIFKMVKDKFSKAFIYLKSVVAKIGTYFLPTDPEGNVLPAISPLTAGQAYADGIVDRSSTLVVMDKEGAKITGCKTSFKDALKLRGGRGNSIKYWVSINEAEQNPEIANVLENYINNFNSINEVQLRALDPQAEYSRITDSDELKDEIKIHLTNKNLGRLMIWGAPGIGKTAILDKALEELGGDFKDYRLIYKTLSSDTPDNFSLPTYVEIDGEKRATDVPKTWLPVYKPTGDKNRDAVLDENCGKGLLFVDELSRATPQVLNVMLPLINEGKFGDGYRLGSGWTVICASNRAEDETSGQTNIGNALANRFTHLFFEPTVKSWRKWADNQGFISPLLLQWLSLPESEKFSGSGFFYMDPNQENTDDDPTVLICTPRAWTEAMQKLAVYSHTGTLEGFTIFDIPDSIIKRALNSRVPKCAVDCFMSFLEVVRGIGDFDIAVYEVWNNEGKGLSIDKKNMSKITMPLAQLICTAHAESLPTKKEWESCCKYLASANSDALASYFLDIYGNVFFAGVDKELWGQILTLGERIRRANGDEAKLRPFRSILNPVLSRWNVSFEDFPNYYDGLKILVDKYGKSFQTAVVGDHMNALS